MAKDRLDGTKKRGFLWELYTAPGRLILWFNYMNPPKGYSKARQAARHARSPIMTFLYATGFWAALALFVYIAITEEDKSNADSNPSQQVSTPSQ